MEPKLKGRFQDIGFTRKMTRGCTKRMHQEEPEQERGHVHAGSSMEGM